MTEDQIERIYERQMDNLDRQLIKNMLTQNEYDKEVNELNKWCKDEYRNRQYREW